MADNSRSSRRNINKTEEKPKKAPPGFDIKNIFGWLAEKATSRSPLLMGLLPTFGTLFTLFSLSLIFSGAMTFWSGLTLTLTSVVPFIPAVALGIIGAALMNFWFHRDVTTAVLNSREIRKGFKFTEQHSTDVYKLVNHVRREINAFYAQKYGYSKIPMPRLCVFTSDKAEIQVTLGRSPDKAALFFSSAFFNAHNTRWNRDHIAALVAHKLSQIHKYRGWSGTIVNIATSLLQTLDYMQTSPDWYFRLLGMLAGPLRFFFYLQRSIERSYSYEATEGVVGIKRGMDFYDAIDIKVAPSLHKQPSYSYLLFDQERKKRAPYTGLFSSWAWFVKLVEKLDSWVLIEDKQDKKGYRVISWLDAIVRETIYFLQELSSSEPRTTRLKDHLRGELKIGKLGKALTEVDRKNSLNVGLGELMKNEELLKCKVIDPTFRQDLIARLSNKLQVNQRQVRAYLNEPLQNYLTKNKNQTGLTPYKKILKEIGAMEAEQLIQNDRNDNEIKAQAVFKKHHAYHALRPVA